METTTSRLLSKLEHNGFKGMIVPIHHLHDLQQEMRNLYQTGLINNALIHKYLHRFQYDYSAELSNAQSIIIVAMPQPITKLCFIWRGKNQEIVVPPTYIYTETEKLVLQIIEEELSSDYFSFIQARLPLKLLAVKSGLSHYGRNNISYIRNMGSFYRLIALISDMPNAKDTWGDVQRMPACNNCSACYTNCPTNCIDLNRNIINASKCLTYINESSEPFPIWVDCTWHNALLGCMNCQLACPQNKNHIQTNNNIILTESQIYGLLHEKDFTRLSKVTQEILINSNLAEYELPTLQRNLKALLPIYSV